jgi:hypothetical protein
MAPVWHRLPAVFNPNGAPKECQETVAAAPHVRMRGVLNEPILTTAQGSADSSRLLGRALTACYDEGRNLAIFVGLGGFTTRFVAVA